MSDNKRIFLGLFEKLTPNSKSNENVTSKQIEQAPVPSFPMKTKRRSFTPVLTQKGIFEDGETVTVLSEPIIPAVTSVKTYSHQSDPVPVVSAYVSQEGLTLDGFLKAVREATRVSRTVSFEVFNRYHLNACAGLIEVLYYIHIENLPAALEYAASLVNEELLNYCLCVVARHRPDFIDNNVQFPSHITTHPSLYVDISKIDSVLLSRKITRTKMTDPIVVDSKYDFTATDVDPEHLVAYFREDIGVNLHHRHWHEVYPTTGVDKIVNADRRGELFLYMHRQIISRYNFDRLSNNLRPVKKFSNFNEHIQEAYYPKLDEASELKIWSPRQPNAQISDTFRDTYDIEVIDIQRWLKRLISAIDRGYAIKKLPNGIEEEFKMEEPRAINDLGNSIEAIPKLSYNYGFYGDIHNHGHILIACCHDPDKRFREPNGVMGKLEAVMRDPMFYRWHAFIDDIAERYYKTLPPYPIEKRQFQGIEIKSVEIGNDSKEKNVIQTLWQQDCVDVTDGILSLKEHPELGNDRPSKVYVKFTHLQHKDFTYKFVVNNNGSKPVTGVVRIFMAPKYDEGRQEMKFNKLRRFVIELDKFTVSLTKGENQFTRKSTCSSVTVPFEQTFMTKEQAYTYTTDEKKREELLSYCGCGWPHHMLIGKGWKTGFPCTLFVMITNYDEDKVEDYMMEACGKSSISYCGVRNKKYPDKRPMGFPFDRPIPDSEADLATFMTTTQFTHDKNPERLTNMFKTEFKVTFNGEKVIPGPTLQKLSTKT